MTDINSCTNEIKSLLKNGNKVFLTKTFDAVGVTQHVFYQTKDNYGNHFYHIRYTITENNEINNLKDFPVVNIPLDNRELFNETINQTTEKILNFIKLNGYNISCDRGV